MAWGPELANRPSFQDTQAWRRRRREKNKQGLLRSSLGWVSTSSSQVANWINVVGVVCCVFLLASWAFLPVEKTHRHYLSISLVCAVMFMNLGFIIPLAGKPEQCFNEITPPMAWTRAACAPLPICWQTVVGRSFMWMAQVLGWGIPIVGLIIALMVSGVSFRFGQTCHINHHNSLADFWIPLLVFAGLTVIIQFATFGYCIKVYLASLADSSASTENSGMPSYTASIRTMTPRQAYRRVRRVIQLQWRGIVIVLIIICDVIFFAVIFVFQDNVVQAAKTGTRATAWVQCLMTAQGDKKSECLPHAKNLVMNGIWLLFLLGRWSMATGWLEMLGMTGGSRAKKDPAMSPMSPQNGRHTPDYFGPGATAAARYQPHSRSFSSPRPPQQAAQGWEGGSPYQQQHNLPPRSPPPRSPPPRSPPPAVQRAWEGESPYQQQPQQQQQQQHSFPPRSPSRQNPDGYVDPLGLNRI
ncbi:hypothetical protein PG987_002967 [Apiospora arundinis]